MYTLKEYESHEIGSKHMKGYFTPARKKQWTILLMAIGWVLLSLMLWSVFAANTKFRLVLFGLYVGAMLVSTVLVIIFRTKIKQIGRHIFKRTPDLLVFLLVGFLLINLLVLYVSAYRFSNSTGALGIVATLLFAVVIFINLPSDILQFVLPRYLLVIFSVFIAIFAIEIFLGNYGKYQVWEAHLNQLFIPAEGVFPGVEGESRFTTDAYGIRGEPYDEVDEGTYRILAIGGSTTETLYLDDTETWTHQIQQLAKEDNRAVWVGNVGRSAHTSLDHYLVLKEFVPYLDFDMVVIMVGINDMNFVTAFPELDMNLIAIPDDLSKLTEKETGYFEQSNFRTSEWRSGLLISLDLFSYNFQSMLEQQINKDRIEVEDAVGKVYDERREVRQSVSQIVNTLPDRFDDGLSMYRANLIALITEAQQQGIPLVLVTQSYVWSDTMPEFFDWYVWEGVIIANGSTPVGRYSLGTLADGMEQYNQVMLEVCEEYDVPCIDVTSHLNGNTDYFYDGVHFNEAGARRVAEVMWDELEGIIFDE